MDAVTSLGERAILQLADFRGDPQAEFPQTSVRAASPRDGPLRGWSFQNHGGQQEAERGIAAGYPDPPIAPLSLGLDAILGWQNSNTKETLKVRLQKLAPEGDRA